MIDTILEKLGLKYEDLTTAEKETLYTWGNAMVASQLTLEHVKKHISAMRDSVEQELTTTAHNSNQDTFLKARLRNYMLLEAFLTSPEKAKDALEKALAGLVSSKS